jgi:hypothetical protein
MAPITLEAGTHSHFTTTHSYHVSPIALWTKKDNPPIRYWKWFVCLEPSGTVLQLGSAPSKTDAVVAINQAIENL